MLGGVQGAAGQRPGSTRRARRSWSSVTVHHTARVRSVRGGQVERVSPSTSPVMSRRRRKETTWLVTSTEPKRSAAVAPAAISASVSRTRMSVMSRASVEYVGVGRLDEGDGVVQVELLARGRSRPGAGRPRPSWTVRVRGGRVDRAEQPAGAGLDDLHRRAAARRGCRPGRRPARGGSSTSPSARRRSRSAADQLRQQRRGCRAEQLEVGLGQRAARRRPRTGAGPST